MTDLSSQVATLLSQIQRLQQDGAPDGTRNQERQLVPTGAAGTATTDDIITQRLVIFRDVEVRLL